MDDLGFFFINALYEFNGSVELCFHASSNNGDAHWNQRQADENEREREHIKESIGRMVIAKT